MNKEIRENFINIFEFANKPIANYTLIGIIGISLILIIYLMYTRKRIIEGNYTTSKKTILKKQKIFANVFLILIFGIIIILLLKYLSGIQL